LKKEKHIYYHMSLKSTDTLNKLNALHELEVPRSLYSSPGYNNNISQ
jgi:hypothetical protein